MKDYRTKEDVSNDIRRANQRKYWKFKQEIFSHYSPELKCQRCGFDDIRALSIDHIKGKGRRHLQTEKIWSGMGLYLWLKRNNYPSEFQVLCANCQSIKRVENHENYRQ